ncbi:hypothetical protein X777_16046 [Ooceraea biroi]|uniref:Uncharacterized protein n=1 Tax=Ooceraea biroi TaxID=2015173 RepID=A0A026WXH3_OOCBI|nr:hypothetical protein X777_16046 [Ooceraea biroi]
MIVVKDRRSTDVVRSRNKCQDPRCENHENVDWTLRTGLEDEEFGCQVSLGGGRNNEGGLHGLAGECRGRKDVADGRRWRTRGRGRG